MRVNTSLFAPMILQGPSLWAYSGWQQCANKVDRRIDINPRELTAYPFATWTDVTLTFTPPKTADRAGETVFMGTAQPATATGAGGTGTTPANFLQTVDAFGYQVWQNSRVVNGQNTLQIIQNLDAYDEYASMYNKEQRDAIAYGAKAELAYTDRQALATNGFDWWVEMPYYWTTTLDRNLNLFAQAIEHTVTIQLNPIAKCYETDRADGVVTGGLTNLRLRILYSHYSAKERDDYLTDVCTGLGLIWKIRDVQRTSIKVPAGTTGIQRYDLNSINGDVQTLVLMPRLDSDTTAMNGQPLGNWQPIPKVRITGNGSEEFYPWTEGDYILYHLHRKAGYPAPAGKKIYRINFERYPALGPNSYSGSLYFGNINQPALEIDWGSTPTAANQTIYVKAIIVNFIQHQNGEVSRVIPTF